jgi:hypothetical protein
MRKIIVVCICVLVVSSIASAQLMDPNWLITNATFPSRTPQVINNGTAIYFDESGVPSRDYDILIEVPLVSEGTLSHECEINITIDAIPLSSTNPSYLEDNELHLGITDGISIIAWTRGDNDNGTGVIFEGEYLTTQGDMDPGYVLFSQAGMPSEFQTVVTLNDTETIVWGQLGSKDDTRTSLRLISPDSELSFVLMGDNDYERYEINWINVEIIPEPTTLLLISLGGMIIRLKRKMKK